MGCVLELTRWGMYPVALLLYFVGPWQTNGTPSNVMIFISAGAMVAFWDLHRFADGMQDTTRNIARIHLLQMRGLWYDDSLKNPVQMLITPNWMEVVAFFHWLLQISSFPLVLFVLGWKFAVPAHGIVLLSGFLPLRYQKHLRHISRHIHNLNSKRKFFALAAGVDVDHLTGLVDQALSEKRKPGDWWAETLVRVTQEQVENDRRQEANNALESDSDRTAADGDPTGAPQG
jgi:hypothetical protein